MPDDALNPSNMMLEALSDVLSIDAHAGVTVLCSPRYMMASLDIVMSSE